MSAPDFHIPVEKEITQFAQHLQTHHRTILSAKFGDGKSYFIDKFEKDKGVSAELKIVKVYPVNYQIASNTDIFTLLKYDILLQLLVNDRVSESSIRGVFLDREISGYSAILLIVFMNLFLLKTRMIPLSLKLKSKAPAN